MAATFTPGKIRTFSLQRTREGHRIYTISQLVDTDFGDGPQAAFEAAGLPLTGDFWNFNGDSDVWAICTPELSVKPYKQREGETFQGYIVTNTFTTIPRKRCQDETIEDPLLEPQRVSGGSNKSTKQAFFDKDEVPILSSSHERLFLEVDNSKHFVSIGQNVASLELDLFAEMIDTLNDASLWGLAKRMVKLSGVSWDRKYHGLCNEYYTRNFDFDVDFTTFDEDLQDVGTLELKPGGVQTNPKDFIQIKDDLDENTKSRGLNGNGAVANSAAAIATITPKYYPESNFLLLGIPTSL